MQSLLLFIVSVVVINLNEGLYERRFVIVVVNVFTTYTRRHVHAHRARFKIPLVQQHIGPGPKGLAVDKKTSYTSSNDKRHTTVTNVAKQTRNHFYFS